MAKMRKGRLSWTRSSSPRVVGYKLYWSENDEVNYESKCVKLKNVTEIVLPDDVNSFKPDGGPIEFGITAIDENGNESDMVTLKATYHFSVPNAPTGFYLRKSEDYCLTSGREHGALPEGPDELNLRKLKDYHVTSVPDSESGPEGPSVLSLRKLKDDSRPPVGEHESDEEEEIELYDILESGNL